MTNNAQYNIRFRPSTLEKLIGFSDEEITKIFKHVKSATAVLLSGATGTGKTTLALAIAAKITSKDSIFEANAAADGGIDDIRKLISMSNRRTLSGGRRVFIIDEVHALSKPAMSALLKPLESDNNGNLWILCTNEPDRLLPTIRRRCLKIETPDWTIERLSRLAKRVAKLTGDPVPKNLKQFVNPSDLLTYMQMPNKLSGQGSPEKRNVVTARNILSVLLGHSGKPARVGYDFKFSTIMEISLAIRGTLGLYLPYESPDPDMMKMISASDPKAVAKLANACAVALSDDTKPPMVLLDILVNSCAHPALFEG